MEVRKLIICRGIQGSGKSTWAKQWCHEDPEHRVRFNNDRNMLGDYWVPSREKIVTATYHTVLANSMEKGYNIVVDNMNLNPKTCTELENMVKDFNENYIYGWEYKVEYKDFFIPVGEKVIRDTWKRYRDFIIHEEVMRVVDNMNKMEDSYSHDKENAIIVDMDSTLCFNTTKRPFWGDGAAEGMLTDIPNRPVCDLVQIMHMQNFKVLIVTGREGSPDIIEATKSWLKNHDIPYDDIFFRPYKDYSKGAPTKERIYKEKIEPNYNVWFYNYICTVPYCDNLTFSIRATRESLKAILSKYPDTFICGQIHYSILEEVFEELGWKINDYSFEHNGWQYDTWFDVLIPGKSIGYHVSCSFAYPEIGMEKFILDEDDVSRAVD